MNEEPHPQAPAREFTEEAERQSPCWHKRHSTGMFSVRRSDGLCCAFAVSLDLVTVVIVVVNKRALHVFSKPAALESFFAAVVFLRLNRFIRNIVGHSGRTSCNALFNASLRANSEPAAFQSKLMSAKMYKHLRDVSVFVSILTVWKQVQAVFLWEHCWPLMLLIQQSCVRERPRTEM